VLPFLVAFPNSRRFSFIDAFSFRNQNLCWLLSGAVVVVRENFTLDSGAYSPGSSSTLTADRSRSDADSDARKTDTDRICSASAERR
jgi:hypothetical protein